jgi:hypothetical protein
MSELQEQNRGDRLPELLRARVVSALPIRLEAFEPEIFEYLQLTLGVVARLVVSVCVRPYSRLVEMCSGATIS